MLSVKEKQRIYRHKRIRKKIQGTPQQPRLCIHRSHKNFSAQIIDDVTGLCVMSLSTLSKAAKARIKYGGNKESAQTFGEIFAAEAQKKGIKKVCFDRGGYLYHGRVKAFAEGARKGGLEF